MHQDPLAQLASTETQQEYLAEENDVIVEAMVFESTEERMEAIDISGIIEESREVLENFLTNTWDEGFNDDFERDLEERDIWNVDENGIESLEITNGRRES
jgi:hypothetical protein